MGELGVNAARRHAGLMVPGRLLAQVMLTCGVGLLVAAVYLLAGLAWALLAAGALLVVCALVLVDVAPPSTSGPTRLGQ